MTCTFNLPEIINATYKIVTPMFIGDANQEATWISPMSFKGALRFWWRALVWGKIRNSVENDEEALKELHKQEAKLFGSTDTGKGKITVKNLQPDKIQKVKDWPPNDANNNSSYLAYGITESGNTPHREGMQENICFDVNLILNGISDGQKKEIIVSLQLLGMFGGLGARSRRGLGAIQLERLNDEQYSIKDANDYQQKAERLLKDIAIGDKAPYTAFSNAANIKSGGALKAARIAHSELGRIYKNYRGQPSSLRGAKKKVFGLPLKGTEEKARQGTEEVRRASPLFFHIISFENGTFGYSVLSLPSSIFHKDKKHQDVDWSLLDGFMNEIGGHQK